MWVKRRRDGEQNALFITKRSDQRTGGNGNEREGRERRRRDAPTMASRHAHAVLNNGQSTARCQTGVSTVNRSFRGATDRGNVGQAGRDFAVARRAIGSEA